MDDSSKINWMNVILLKDFIYNLEIDALKEVSLLAKLAREKLSPRLFRNLKISTVNCDFDFKDNMLLKYFGCLSDPDLIYSVSKEAENWDFESGLAEFNFSLKNIRLFAVSFSYVNMSKAGYYLISMVNGMDNLVVLNLRHSAIPYSSFANIGELLPNLKDIELYYITFVKSIKDSNSLDNFKFPPYLRALKVYVCDIFNIESLSNPYEFLFNENTQGTRANFQLPNTRIPTLKKLSYHNAILQYDSLEQFLETNSELESLNIEIFNSKLINNLTLLNSLELGSLLSFDNSFHIHNLELLKNLKINSAPPIYYENIRKLCSLCPNLEYLYFKMAVIDYFQPSIDTFLVPMLTNMTKLKTLELVVLSSEDEELNIKHISNVESLIIGTRSSTISSLIFDVHNTLKSVTFKSFSCEINSKKFKDKFNSYKNWVFEFGKKAITGHKVE
jgi:hypothetical protein